MNGESIGAPAPWARTIAGPPAGPSKIMCSSVITPSMLLYTLCGLPAPTSLRRDPDARATGGDRTPAAGEPPGGLHRAAAPRPRPPSAYAGAGGAATPGVEADLLRAGRAGGLPLQPRARDPRPLHGAGGQAERRGLHGRSFPLGGPRRTLGRGPSRGRPGDGGGPLQDPAAEPGEEAARPFHLDRGRLRLARRVPRARVVPQGQGTAAHPHRPHPLRPPGGGRHGGGSPGGQEARSAPDAAISPRRAASQPAAKPARRRATAGPAAGRVGGDDGAPGRGDRAVALCPLHAGGGGAFGQPAAGSVDRDWIDPPASPAASARSLHAAGGHHDGPGFRSAAAGARAAARRDHAGLSLLPPSGLLRPAGSARTWHAGPLRAEVPRLRPAVCAVGPGPPGAGREGPRSVPRRRPRLR